MRAQALVGARVATSETTVAAGRSSAFASATFPTQINLYLKVAELKAADSGDKRKFFRLRPCLLRAPRARLPCRASARNGSSKKHESLRQGLIQLQTARAS